MNREANKSGSKAGGKLTTKSPEFSPFFESAYNTFREAFESAAEPIENFYEVGGQIIRLRLAGNALAPYITPALEHLRTDTGREPALTICGWDNVSTSTVPPPLPWPFDDYVKRGGIHTYKDERFRGALYGGLRILNALDAERNLALYCIHNASDFPWYQVSSPLIAVLQWGLQKYGLQFVHAAAVGRADLGGVLIAGKGGSGKSTIALSCLDSPLGYVSDDYCLISLEPEPYAYNLYGSAKLDSQHILRLGHLAEVADKSENLKDGKKLIFVHRLFADKIEKGFRVLAILVPRITGQGETKLRRVSASCALRGLAPSTLYQLPDAGPKAFKTISEFVKRVDCYDMELGTDISAIPEVIMNLLSDSQGL
jgi:hypothetical protein